MKSAFKYQVFLLLLFNATGALYGGYNLIEYPDGSSIGLSLTLLKHSGFRTYLLPGIILFLCNGVSSLLIAGAVIFKNNNYPLLVLTQGMILTGWITVQIFLIETFSLFQVILGSTGIVFIVFGLVEMKNMIRLTN